jgi:hypothetical protein
MKMSKFKIVFLLLLSMNNIQRNMPLHNKLENHCIRNKAQTNIFRVVSTIHSSFSLINKRLLIFIFILYVMKQHNKHKTYMIDIMKVLKSEICT